IPKPTPANSSPSLIVIDGGRAAPEGAAVQIPSVTHPATKVGLTIGQAFDAWKNYTKGRPRKPQLIQEWNLAVRRFVSMFGDIDMGEIRPQMVRDFREKLLELPSRAKKSIKVLPLDDQAEIAASEGLPT